MKKILLVNASNRKRNTYNILLSIEAILKNKGYETEVINLYDYKIDFCRGCEVCILKVNAIQRLYDNGIYKLLSSVIKPIGESSNSKS